MTRYNRQVLCDNKYEYYYTQLKRELEHLFEWDGLPPTIPADYIERVLISDQPVMFYEHNEIGIDALACAIQGQNRHNQPTLAYTNTLLVTEGTTVQETRTIKRLTDSIDVTFDKAKDCVIVQNMAHGESLRPLLDHFAKRLDKITKAFDINVHWSSIPYIFNTSDDDTKLSLEKMFAEIDQGAPFIIADKQLFMDNAERAGTPTNIKLIAKELFDLKNELLMEFRRTVGIETAGVDKAERVNTLEVESNNQHTRTVLEIMLRQRRIAAENLNEFFGLNVTVDVVGKKEQEEAKERQLDQMAQMKEGEINGTSDGGTEAPAGKD